PTLSLHDALPISICTDAGEFKLGRRIDGPRPTPPSLLPLDPAVCASTPKQCRLESARTPSFARPGNFKTHEAQKSIFAVGLNECELVAKGNDRLCLHRVRDS